MEIFNCEQGTEEWFRVRAGMPTASEFSTIMASGRGGGESEGRRTYMHKLAGEIITGEPMESFNNVAMERGKAMEAEARDMYAFLTDAVLDRVGFIKNGPKGCSPDALIGTNGAVEFKTTQPHLLIDLLLKDEFPPKFKAQCQGVLWVAEREWIDLGVFWPKMPMLIKRAHRDPSYIVGLSSAVKRFNEELHEVVEKIRRYGKTPDKAAENAATEERLLAEVDGLGTSIDVIQWGVKAAIARAGLPPEAQKRIALAVERRQARIKQAVGA